MSARSEMGHRQKALSKTTFSAVQARGGEGRALDMSMTIRIRLVFLLLLSLPSLLAAQSLSLPPVDLAPTVVGRFRPGASLTEAQQDIRSIGNGSQPRISCHQPRPNAGGRLSATPLILVTPRTVVDLPHVGGHEVRKREGCSRACLVEPGIAASAGRTARS